VTCPVDNPACTPDQTVATFSAMPNPDWADSWVQVRCETTGFGVLTRTNDLGGVDETMPFQCSEGDMVTVGYERDDGPSFAYCLILQDGPSSTSLRCP
jgi:hypothetical protein